VRGDVLEREAVERVEAEELRARVREGGKEREKVERREGERSKRKEERVGSESVRGSGSFEA